MINGVLVALGIIVVSELISIVHFIAVPASPFIGGYVGISFARSSPGTYAMKGLQFGGLLGLLVLLVAAAAAGVVTVATELTQKVMVMMWIGVALFTLYAASMSTLGAMYASLKSRSTPDEAAEE